MRSPALSVALLLIALTPAHAQSSKPSKPAPAKVPDRLNVTAGQSVRYKRTASVEVEVKQGKRLLRQHKATFALTYELEVQAATKKRIVWTLKIEQASGTESGKGEVALGPARWSLQSKTKPEAPLTLQLGTDLRGRLRGRENGEALLRFRRASGSGAATQYLFGDDPKEAGVADGPLTIAPLLPAKRAASWTTKSGQAYGYLVADATRFRESWTWSAKRAGKGQVSAESQELKVEALEPLEEGVKVTPKVTRAKARTVVDLRTGLPESGSWVSAFSFSVKKYGLTMSFRREEHLDRLRPKVSPPETPPKKR